MADPRPHDSDLVMTQAELPPGIDAPPPETGHDNRPNPAEAGPSVDLLQDVKRLAERAGGIDQLRRLVDQVAGAAH